MSSATASRKTCTVIAPRGELFAKGHKVFWLGGSGQVTKVFPGNMMLVEGKEASPIGKVCRTYHTDGVLGGRYETNDDLTLYHNQDDVPMGFLYD